MISIVLLLCVYPVYLPKNKQKDTLQKRQQTETEKTPKRTKEEKNGDKNFCNLATHAPFIYHTQHLLLLIAFTATIQTLARISTVLFNRPTIITATTFWTEQNRQKHGERV